jgi:hypothetical protein
MMMPALRPDRLVFIFLRFEVLRYSIAFRKKIYHSIEELQQDVDEWLLVYNCQRPHSGRYCYGKTPMQTFAESKHLAEAKMLDKQQALVGQSYSEVAVG